MIVTVIVYKTNKHAYYPPGMKAARNELEKAFFAAAKNGDLAEVERLAAVPVDVNCRDEVCTSTESPVFRTDGIYANTSMPTQPPPPPRTHKAKHSHSQTTAPFQYVRYLFMLIRMANPPRQIAAKQATPAVFDDWPFQVRSELTINPLFFSLPSRI